jgi:hypothetical protein
MGLDLTPRDYLEMLTDEYQEYLKNPLSMRKAINCCGLSNALPEVIIVHQNPADSPDGLKRKASAYRKQLEQRCPAHHTVRDFCDYSKHVKLRRKCVNMKEAERIEHTAGSPIGLTLVFTHPEDVELLVLRHRNGREEYLHEVLAQVIASWNEILDETNL